MMPEPDRDDAGAERIRNAAKRHGFGEEAARAMARALAAGHGAMAQFDHPELGGMGQWSRGGMLMIGDMFNDGLKARVGALASDLADSGGEGAAQTAGARQATGDWWPADLGRPSSSGAQNGHRYAVFPDKRRLAVERNGRVTLYDTAGHRIEGAAQQQAGGDASTLRFSGRGGTIRLEDLAPA